MPVYAIKGKKRKYRVRIWYRGVRQDWIVEGTKRDAEAFEARQRVELEQSLGRPKPRTVPRFSDFCVEAYRPHAELRLKAGTWYRRQSQIANLAERVGARRLTEIGPEEVEAYARGRLQDGLKPVSVNNELRVLKRILNFARKERGLPVAEPTWGYLREPPSEVDPFTAAEVDRILRAAAKLHPQTLLPMLVFLANTGCRKGEALVARWDWVHFDRGAIRITPNEAWQPKSNKPREVPISDALMPWLTRSRRSDVWLFPSRKGERYAVFPEKQWDDVCAAAGVTGGPHRLRHTFASHFLAQQPDLFLLAQVLGHSDEAVTRLYAHLLPDHLQRARNAVSFESPVGPAAIEAAERWGGESAETVPATVPEKKTGRRRSG